MSKTSKLISKNIRVIKNFPKKGILFQDIFSLTEKPMIFNAITTEIVRLIKQNRITKIAGIESRGFIFASAAALKSQIPFIPIRKPNKLPGPIYKQKYKLEYGSDEIQIQKNAITKNDKILIVDDLIATGGTALAAHKLVKKHNSKIITFFFVINLENLKGTSLLTSNKADVVTLFNTQG
tara:strand:+ start:2346 stop:2885 length:540 start_codon:yes stop_codon:yes gene_type:complete